MSLSHRDYPQPRPHLAHVNAQPPSAPRLNKVMDEETQTLLTQWKMDDYIELFEEKPESNQSGVAVENAKEFSDVSDFILNINNELEDLPLGNYKIATTTEKRVQKVWSNKQSSSSSTPPHSPIT
ncbi:hypothetical protein EVAR_102623_1 [Eumeta japonica]|uniref:Uncharacterized protein n=1 Tax=Eumeta variegata TaxID=151549 RepID=A0A4C1TV50_EUMVA|nr:hypothetical protein EVAR_102623_1 [Eumeta japonica]